MAISCVHGSGECTGCGACRERDEDEALYVCKSCGEDIYEGDTYYDVDGETYCECCVTRLKA